MRSATPNDLIVQPQLVAVLSAAHRAAIFSGESIVSSSPQRDLMGLWRARRRCYQCARAVSLAPRPPRHALLYGGVSASYTRSASAAARADSADALAPWPRWATARCVARSGSEMTLGTELAANLQMSHVLEQQARTKLSMRASRQVAGFADRCANLLRDA